jgi:hypothetical protein
MGKAETLSTLVNFHTNEPGLELDFNLKDNNGDTPLTLLCMKGFSKHEELAEKSEICKKRASMVEQVLPLMQRESLLQKHRNTSLHWCVYNGDLISGVQVFRKMPELFMEKNMFDETPLDIFILKKVRNYNFSNSITLMQHLCTNFGKILTQFIQNHHRADNILTDPQYKILNELSENLSKTREIDQFSNDSSSNRIYIYSKKDSMMSKPFVKFLHKLLIGSVILNIPNLARFLMDDMGISPFWRGANGKSALHYASELKNTLILDKILGFEYYYVNKNREMDLKAKVLKAQKKSGNIGLHFAALRNNLKNFNMLKDTSQKGLEIKNQRILKPQECTRDPKFGSIFDFEKKKFMENLEKENETLTKTKSQIDALLGTVSHGYQYAIVSRDKNKYPRQTLIYSQLNRVNKLQGMSGTNYKGDINKDNYDPNPFHSNVSVYKDELVIGGNANDYDDEEHDNELFLGGNGNFENVQLIETNQVKRDIYDCVEFKGNMIKVKWIELEDYQVPRRGFYRHCFLIGLNEEGLDEIADIQNLKVYNHTKNMPDYFELNKKLHYERFRDSQLQNMLFFLLEREFDIEYFQENGIIESHFFLHQSPYNNSIPSEFWKNNIKLVGDNLLPKSSRRDLLNGMGMINHYFGPNIGLYLGFNNLYTSWLIFLSIIGIITFVLIYVLAKGDFDYEGLPVYGVIIIVVVTFVDEFWKRRESELVYLWDLRAYSMNEPQRKEHKGRFIIDPVSREIRKKSALSTSQRRLITEIPVILLGLFFIIGNYVLFYFLNKNIAEKKKNKEITINEAKYLGYLIGAGNGVSISILNMIYQAVVKGVISWENHRYESTLKGSRIPKLFLFNFCMHYINLFFYAFYLQDFTVLRSNFISLFITRAFSNILLTYGLPLTLYWFKKTLLRKKLAERWHKRKSAFLKQNVVSGKWFYDLPKLIQTETKEYERELYLWYQTEHELIRPVPFDMTLIWMNQILQFGLLVFFGVVFPLAPLIGLVYNLLDSYLLCFCASKINKRPKIIMLPNAGIWTYMITLMTFMALVINTSLFAFVSHGFRDLVDANGDYQLLLLLIISEHVVLGVKILLGFVISDIPKWVTLAIKNRKTKKRMYIQSKNERKILKRLTKQLSQNNPMSYINKMGKHGAPMEDDFSKYNQILNGIQKKRINPEEKMGGFGFSSEAIRHLNHIGDAQVEEEKMDLMDEEEMENVMLTKMVPFDESN